MSTVINESAMNAFLYGETSPLALFIDRKARRTNQLAITNASGRPGPRIRSGELVSRLRYPGIVATPEGPVAWILTDAKSPRQDFNYPKALEIGMPEYAPLPINPRTGRLQGGYHYPFLKPALEEAFNEV